MNYKPFETTRKDLVFPRGAGGNFIMHQLHIDEFRGATLSPNDRNEFFFDHTKAYRNDTLYAKYYDFLDRHKKCIADMYSSAKNVTAWSEGWAISYLYDFVFSDEFTRKNIEHIPHQQFTRIANSAVGNSVRFTTQLHNDIISEYKKDGIIVCAHHTPDLYAFLHADLYNRDYKNYLNNELNYYYGFINIRKDDTEVYDYINQIRAIKRNRNISDFGSNTYEREVEIFPRLFPNCQLFDWRALFLEFNEDLWEELFVYFEKEHNWKDYRNDIIDNVKSYTDKNNKLLA